MAQDRPMETKRNPGWPLAHREAGSRQCLREQKLRLNRTCFGEEGGQIETSQHIVTVRKGIQRANDTRRSGPSIKCPVYPVECLFLPILGTCEARSLCLSCFPTWDSSPLPYSLRKVPYSYSDYQKYTVETDKDDFLKVPSSPSP